MRCAWKELLGILPPGIRAEVDEIGKESLQELRLRINAPPELVLPDRKHRLDETVTREDIQFLVNTATRYSPWTAASASQGYITVPGGHRIGLCGEAVCKNGEVTGIRTVRSVCVRVARDFPGIGAAAAKLETSILILGPPGSGKTTLLRDLVRQISRKREVCVVDERSEIFPDGFEQGQCLDVLTGAPRSQGIEMVLRTMGPEYIAVDEITSETDCRSLMEAAHCGIRLLATAHAGSLEDFSRRKAYRRLREESVFQTLLILGKDKHFTVERMDL